MARRNISRYGTVYSAISTPDRHRVTLERWDGRILHAGYIDTIRTNQDGTRRTSIYFAYPACGCERIAYQTLGGAAITLANAAANVQDGATHDGAHA